MVSQYPKSILAPAAMLRQALAYQNQQQTAAYRSTLKKLTQAYPKSPEAKEADKWLKEGKKEAPPAKAAGQGPGQGARPRPRRPNRNKEKIPGSLGKG